MNTFFKGKKLLVVGGTSGMGLAVARMVLERQGLGIMHAIMRIMTRVLTFYVLLAVVSLLSAVLPISSNMECGW